jgi:hypothetical protein
MQFSSDGTVFSYISPCLFSGYFTGASMARAHYAGKSGFIATWVGFWA